MARPPSRRDAAHRVDLPREGGGKDNKQYIGGGKTLPRRIPTSPSAGEGDASRKAFVRHLREDMTDTERKLWQELRAKRFENYKFRRQVPVGRYVVDFICYEHRLIVEVDGSRHDGSEHDALRDAWLTSHGFRVLRFWNIDVLQAMDGTLLAIQEALKA